MDIVNKYSSETVKNNSSTENQSDQNNFDVIILLDLSGSMYTRDFKMEETELVIETIREQCNSTVSENFISKIKDKDIISRYEGALVGILLYILRIIERGSDDKVSIIPFSDTAKVIKFGDEQFISSSDEDIKNRVDELIETAEAFLRSSTDISTSLAESIEVMKSLDKDKMKMIVLLTDENSHDRLPDLNERLQNILNKRLSPREDIVINTVGLGDKVPDELLNSIADKTGGEYSRADCLPALLKAFSHFSQYTSERASVIFEG